MTDDEDRRVTQAAARSRMWERLARVQLSPTQLQAAIAAAVLIALVAIAIAIPTAARQSAVARSEAARAVAAAQQAEAASSTNARAAVCQFAEGFVIAPDDPAGPTQPYGVQIAENARALARAFACPPS
jgi:hypothetical protein